MNFMDAVRTCLNNYANFSGRARRSEFWWFVLFNFCVQIATSIVDTILATLIGINVLSFIVMLALIVPGIAVSVRRMHDIGRSGWFVLLGLIPLVGPIILIIWYVKPGTPGPNQYGEDPKGGLGAMPQQGFAAPQAGYAPPQQGYAPPPSAAAAPPPAAAPRPGAAKGPRPWER
jgi:uncharacterized membrane protein YhaH (DUF805 family)